MSLNVLVVDDSAVMRSIIIKTLRLSGLAIDNVYQAANGNDALSMLAKIDVQLAVLDIKMPGMNGEKLLEIIRHDPKNQDLPVVVVSTEGSDTIISRVIHLGAAFVHKPFTIRELKDVVLSKLGATHVRSL